MDKRLLIAYGTAAGSTAEVAQAIGEEMQNTGAQVDIIPVEDVKDLSGYDAVVIGSAVRVFKLLKKTRRFIKKYKKELKQVPLAYFLVCLTMEKDTPENVRQAKEFAKPMLDLKEPVSLGLFGGCINHEKLTGLFAQTMKAVPEQDHRDWDEIRAWGRETISKLLE